MRLASWWLDGYYMEGGGQAEGAGGAWKGGCGFKIVPCGGLLVCEQFGKRLGVHAAKRRKDLMDDIERNEWDGMAGMG
jgi:hypothetical protein